MQYSFVQNGKQLEWLKFDGIEGFSLGFLFNRLNKDPLTTIA